ncbi:hypothetical protein NECAME_09407 [Necator americanus]|uniref:Uncharacterized protein n=1 Tax=Necator americanus TaxID=51031 RepID=W2TGE0_NECAM|nr:hypothetical protein NECAME_09407 [Necator americanus]ETN80087.1 hypothetical protein NECAME_09407 [Necator americanus]
MILKALLTYLNQLAGGGARGAAAGERRREPRTVNDLEKGTINHRENLALETEQSEACQGKN